ncbi:MAG: protease inhibitor I42 family protein [Anaerolineae bacterium]|nr:protease inhibitor I42 family protein [Anaerolineae bacterium]
MEHRGWKAVGLVVVLLVVAALVSGCGGSAKAGLEGGEVVLAREDMGAQVALHEGQTLVVTLEANPSTGYSWELIDLEEQVLALAGEPEFQQAAQANVVGASELQILRLEAKGAGTTTLTLVYHRPWETDVEPLETLTVEVEVR